MLAVLAARCGTAANSRLLLAADLGRPRRPSPPRPTGLALAPPRRPHAREVGVTRRRRRRPRRLPIRHTARTHLCARPRHRHHGRSAGRNSCRRPADGEAAVCYFSATTTSALHATTSGTVRRSSTSASARLSSSAASTPRELRRLRQAQPRHDTPSRPRARRAAAASSSRLPRPASIRRASFSARRAHAPPVLASSPRSGLKFAARASTSPSASLTPRPARGMASSEMARRRRRGGGGCATRTAARGDGRSACGDHARRRARHRARRPLSTVTPLVATLQRSASASPEEETAAIALAQRGEEFEREKEGREMTHPHTWDPREAHADSHATSDKTASKTTRGPQPNGFVS